LLEEMNDVSSMIADILKSGRLPEKTNQVQLVQTHISWVFVAERFVYKVKKPVNFGFLDFSTLEKREFYCQQELRLNQRLSTGIYLAVLPVTYDGKRYRIGEGPGEICDYAVKMRRIPEQLLMKSLFEEGKLQEGDLRNIAQLMAKFHLAAEGSEQIDTYGEAEQFKVNTDENFQQTGKYIGKTIRQKDFDLLRKWTDEFYLKNRPLFRARIEEGRIRDCHGDLHMEHVCLTQPVSVIDCIEFNERFRYSDTVSDIAFLLMDLEYHGGKDLAARLWDYYAAETGEGEVGDLLTFYKVYRAYVRGKVNSFQTDDGQLSPEERQGATQKASRYFQLACSYVT